MAQRLLRKPEAAAPVLSVEELTVRFGAVRALDAVDFEIRPGEAVALAGENGAGKSTLVRCIAGDIAPTSGRVRIAGRRVASDPSGMARNGVAVVWQDLALCDNLDVAANLLLGRERRGLLRSPSRFHTTAAELLQSLSIPLHDTTISVRSLSGGQRQLLAVARAMHARPRLLILDEPTASLGVTEAAQVEQLTHNAREQGTTVLLVTHDIDQMFRLADRIVVLRHGRLAGEVDPARSHPDDVLALMLGQEATSSARRQLTRLEELVDRLASADLASSLHLILSVLGSALAAEQLCIHLVDGTRLRLAGVLGLAPGLVEAWRELPVGPDGGPVGLAAGSQETFVDHDIASSAAWSPWMGPAGVARVRSSWAVPIVGADGLAGVITVFRPSPGRPLRDELNLVGLYAGYAAGVVEQERLLGEVTARNRVLETIREVLETLAGPVPFDDGLPLVLQSLRSGLQADEVVLLAPGDPLSDEGWAVAGADGSIPLPSPMLSAAADQLSNGASRPGRASRLSLQDGGSCSGVTFATPGGPSMLLAYWARPVDLGDATALLENAANSLRLAHERQESERARQEATALRRSRALQRDFLSRLSHELRTPLTAIQGYASSLMAPDVTWDGESEVRFLSRMAAESARLNRLVDDLLDFSAIESSIMRLAPDWCHLALVLDAAIACVTAPTGTLELRCDPELPVIWADHDRLEQVFVNLIENAVRHNPPGTQVSIEALAEGADGVVVRVSDGGGGIPEEIAAELFQPRRQSPRTATAGAGLGLSIAKGIVDAHGGRIAFERLAPGARFSVHLPVEQPMAAPVPAAADASDV